MLFPEISDIAITKAIVSNVDSIRLDTLNVALVRYTRPMGASQTKKFKEYLEARLQKRNITIVDAPLR